MCEQTRQEIGGDLAYAMRQVGMIITTDLPGSARRDCAQRALDALERIQAALERGERPHHPTLAERLADGMGVKRTPDGWEHV